MIVNSLWEDIAANDHDIVLDQTNVLDLLIPHFNSRLARAFSLNSESVLGFL